MCCSSGGSVKKWSEKIAKVLRTFPNIKCGIYVCALPAYSNLNSNSKSISRKSVIIIRNENAKAQEK